MKSTRPFILLFNPVEHAVSFYQHLQKIARAELVTSKSRDEFFSDLQGKYRDISIIYKTSASGAVAGKFDADLIYHLSRTCKHICHNGAGYDQIDVNTCTERGIIVPYAPGPVTEATADLTI